MQKEKPKSIRSEFEQAAELPEELQLKRRVAALPSNLQAVYQMTLDQQSRDLRNLHNEIADCHDDNIADLTQRLRDRWEHERSLDLKPKYLPSVSDEELTHQASEQASVEIEIEEDERLQKLDRDHFQERWELVITLETRYATHSHFNEIARITIASDRGEDHER
jgi:hypothetical protein